MKMENEEIIKVNELIENRNSVEEADILINKIRSSDAPIIKIDWENSGVISIAFVDRLLSYLKTSGKNIIDLNLHDDEKKYIRNIMRDPREKKYFK